MKGEICMPEEVTKENERLIYGLANQFYGIEKEDLIQAGYLGLTKAYNNYDPKRSNAKFSTYAYGFIHGEMYEAATGNRLVRVRKPELKLYKGIIKTKELLESKYDREVSYEETCEFLKVDFSTFMSILNAMSASVSIDNTELNVSNRDNLEDRLLLNESLETLSPLEKSVIEKRYMEDLSQQEAAKILNLSQVKVSRIEKQSKEKMKNFIMS